MKIQEDVKFVFSAVVVNVKQGESDKQQPH